MDKMGSQRMARAPKEIGSSGSKFPHTERLVLALWRLSPWNALFDWYSFGILGALYSTLIRELLASAIRPSIWAKDTKVSLSSPAREDVVAPPRPSGRRVRGDAKQGSGILVSSCWRQRFSETLAGSPLKPPVAKPSKLSHSITYNMSILICKIRYFLSTPHVYWKLFFKN